MTRDDQFIHNKVAILCCNCTKDGIQEAITEGADVHGTKSTAF